jgi:predicted RNA binding protein YcfA (HicA-like mRNA interferase family)
MSKLANIDRRKLIKALRSLGFEVNERRGKGSHAVIFHPNDAARSTSLPVKSPVPKGTLRNMLRDLEISRESLESVL